MKNIHVIVASVSWLVGPLVTSAWSQTPLHELHGVHAYSSFGTTSCALGDLDADGHGDFAVAAIREDTFGIDAGVVRAYSGATGALLATLHGGLQETFGKTLVDAGDVDGDGLHDLLIGAPRLVGPFNYGPGSVHVVSTATWTPIRTHAPSAGQHQYGFSLAGNVDIDADGTPDVIIGDYAFMNFVGAVDVYSGANGALLHHLLPPFDSFQQTYHQDAFGEAVAGVSDVDGDGHADVLVGAPAGGYARLYSGATGLELRAYVGAPDAYGLPVANAGDLDGDGIDEHAVAGFDGDVDLFAGATGSLIRTLVGPSTSGSPLDIANIGDVDGDQVPDLVVGLSTDSTVAPNGGSARIYSGANGALVASLFGAAAENLGGGFAAGDVDADGRPDFTVTLSGSNAGAGTQSGSARVYSLSAPPVAVYCSAKINSLGCIPFVGFSGVPSLSNALPFVVRAYNTLNKKNGLLFYGFAPSSTPFQGGVLCVQPPIKRTTPTSSNGDASGSNCSGGYAFDFGELIQAGSDPALVLGANVHGQFWTRDPNASFGSGLTDAAAFLIGP